MKVLYKSTLYKSLSVFRFLMLKCFYGSRLKTKGLSMIGKRCGFYIKKGGEVICKGRVIVNDDVMIFTKGQLSIGKNLGINSYSRVVAHERIEIGDNVTIAQRVSILDHDHNYDVVNKNLILNGYQTSPISIGNNVWIGDGSIILKGVSIGNNVIVGANTLVNKDVSDNCVVAGSPFKVIKTL